VIKTILRSGIAIGFAIFAGRQLVYGGRDLARYNKMREMSDDPPLGVPTHKAETNAAARTKNPFVMLASIPSDIGHYIKMKTM
jgi:urocanate hydratase